MTALPAPGTELKVNLNQPTAICQETETKETVITKIFIVIYILIYAYFSIVIGTLEESTHVYTDSFHPFKIAYVTASNFLVLV